MILGHRRAPLVFGAAVLAALAAWLLLFRSSPGELAEPHRQVAGSSFIGNCRKCHAPGGLNAGCLSCHTEIASQLAARRGYHGRLTGSKAGNCAACHSDHNGRDFAMVNKVSWGGADPAAFTHAQTTFTLTGAHAKLACADCHVKKAPSFSLPRFPKLKRSATYLGLRQDCASCHNDPHAGGKAANCAACHTQDKFKPARNFDHDKFFPLRDGHAKVACAKCHKTTAAAAPDKIFGAVAGRTCKDCHASPHRAAWTAGCADCHTARAVPWASARERMTKAWHAATGFRLEKPHERTRCAACHDPARPYAERHPSGAQARTQKNCAACHRDKHAGQFRGRTCLDCHSETAFVPSSYSRKQHASVYPLEGAHSKAACGACHIYDEGLKAVRYAGTREDCAFCHKDPHAGQFRVQGRTSCEKCHRDSASWRKTIFNHDTMSSFKLSSAHAKVACKACHPEAVTSGGRRVTLYKPLKHACGDCHAPPQ
jgi:hypothetical protein